METYTNVYYFYYLNAIGGTETFLYQLAKKYKNYDLTIFYRYADPNQLRRLRKYARCIQFVGQEIYCEKVFFNYGMDIIDNVHAKKYYCVIHADYEAMKDGSWSEDFIKKPNKQMRSVWAIGTTKPYEKEFGKHPTQKPLELLRRIILASTNKGDLILDPFAGSSTTGIMALELERKFIGIDLEKEYLDLSVKRFEQVFSKKDKARWQ